jgi:signal peptidase II
LLGCVAGLVGCDHATKLAAESTLRSHGPVDIVPGVVDLAYTENRDVAFDALSRLSLHPSSVLLVGLALAMTAAVVGLWVSRRRARWPEHAGFAMVVAGALGNAIDRATRGHVIDFVHVRFWPVFNVADVLVVLGVAVLVLARSSELTEAERG